MVVRTDRIGRRWLDTLDANQADRGNAYPVSGETSLTITGLTTPTGYKAAAGKAPGPAPQTPAGQHPEPNAIKALQGFLEGSPLPRPKAVEQSPLSASGTVVFSSENPEVGTAIRATVTNQAGA